MGFLYSEVQENGLIDDEVLKNIPSTCNDEFGCGSELEFTENLIQLYCPNRYCTHKIASRLESMAKEMQADGWGVETCLQVVDTYKLKSPCQVFLLENLSDDALNKIRATVSAFDKKLANICDMNRRKVQLWQVVKLMNIPGIASNALKIFTGFNTMEEAYEVIESKQVPFIMERLGISKNNESSVMAVETYNTLLEYKEELISAQKRFDLYVPKGESLKIAITGGVYGYTNKAEFIKHLNFIGEGKFSLSLMNTVSTQIDILVADGDKSSRKYKTACKINEKAGEEKIKLLDGDSCERYLRSRFNIKE